MVVCLFDFICTGDALSSIHLGIADLICCSLMRLIFVLPEFIHRNGYEPLVLTGFYFSIIIDFYR